MDERTARLERQLRETRRELAALEEENAALRAVILETRADLAELGAMLTAMRLDFEVPS